MNKFKISQLKKFLTVTNTLSKFILRASVKFKSFTTFIKAKFSSFSLFTYKIFNHLLIYKDKMKSKLITIIIENKYFY